jgi:hypothetical protein
MRTIILPGMALLSYGLREKGKILLVYLRDVKEGSENGQLSSYGPPLENLKRFIYWDFSPFGAKRPIYGSYRTANLQTLHFKYFFNKYPY